MNLYLKDPNTGKPSAPLTMFIIGMVISCLKLAVAGMMIKGFSMSPFTGVDFAAAVGALGTVYVLHKPGDAS